MNTRKIWPFLLLAMLLPSVKTLAQQPGASILEDQQLIDARELLQAGRRDIVAEELRLTQTEAETFWPIYEDYQADIKIVRDQHADSIGTYLRRYQAGDITEEYADELLRQGLAFRNNLLEVQERYVREFRRALPIRKLVRFYQLESKMDAEVDAQLAVFIPLIDIV